MSQLIVIILAMLLGYACRRLPVADNVLHKLLMALIILLLLMMGYHSGVYIKQVPPDLIVMGKTIMLFVVMLLLLNMLSITGVFYYFSGLSLPKEQPSYSIKQAMNDFFMGAHYVGWVFLGVSLGYVLELTLPHLELLINAALLGMLFIIGFQLRQQEILLHEMFFNKQGILISLLVVLSSMLAGVICAVLLHLPIGVGLVLTAGYGWYTLSAVLTQQMVSEYFGTVVFFIDFLHELIALILIPVLGRVSYAAAIGYGGATALDCSLPIIRVNLGQRVVPIAVTSGMVLTILPPILIPLFANMVV
jgi:uncharacterized membrane protein YbjE (DUF340 family)